MLDIIIDFRTNMYYTFQMHKYDLLKIYRDAAVKKRLRKLTCFTSFYKIEKKKKNTDRRTVRTQELILVSFPIYIILFKMI